VHTAPGSPSIAAGLVSTLLTDSGLLAIALVVLAVLALVALTTRRRWITRYGGTFECCYAPPGQTRFRRGIARYSGDGLEFFRWMSVLSRPELVLNRADVTETKRRAPRAREAYLLGVDNPVVVEVETRQGLITVALDESSFTGLLSWVDSAPPRPFADS
jgi:Protein of unknown function (DUF2550)